MSEVGVWCSVDGRVDEIIISEDANVSRLRKVIKEEWQLSCPPVEIKIFISEGAAEELPPQSPIPTETTAENALIVEVPWINDREEKLLFEKN